MCLFCSFFPPLICSWHSLVFFLKRSKLSSLWYYASHVKKIYLFSLFVYFFSSFLNTESLYICHIQSSVLILIYKLNSSWVQSRICCVTVSIRASIRITPSYCCGATVLLLRGDCTTTAVLLLRCYRAIDAMLLCYCFDATVLLLRCYRDAAAVLLLRSYCATVAEEI